MFLAASGTLTITESTSKRLKGSFEYMGVSISIDEEEEPDTVTVEGSFDAEWAPDPPSATRIPLH